MKKLLALFLALAMVFALAACGEEETKETEAAQAEPFDGTPLEVLEEVWGMYGAQELFSVVGGDVSNMVDGAPGSYSMELAEDLQYTLHLPAEVVGRVKEAATLVHMMNANSFTCGALRMDGAEEAAQLIRDSIQNQQWMCGFPETLYVAVLGDIVVMAYGIGDAMNSFTNHFAEVYPQAKVMFHEAIAI